MKTSTDKTDKNTYMLWWGSTLIAPIVEVLFLLNFPNNEITKVKMWLRLSAASFNEVDTT